MQRRIRLDWSPKCRRRWCPGGRPLAESAVDVPKTGRTVFLRVQSLVELLRHRDASEPSEVLGAEPPARSTAGPSERGDAHVTS